VAGVRTYRYWSDRGWWGDQGATPQCVAYAWTHWLEDGPVAQPGRAPCVDPAELYRAAQRADEWEGEDYDGTSVRAGAKVLKARGYIAEYRWARTIDALVYALLEQGPVVLGVNWYAGMESPDARGIVRAAGEILGGHAIVANGVNVPRGLVRLKNSWGRAWGRSGRCWLPIDDLARLVAEEGEACLAVEKKQQTADSRQLLNPEP
jgi:hypothetical protein